MNAQALDTGDADLPEDHQVSTSTSRETAKKPGYHVDGFRFRPSVTVSGKYDDNIFATESGKVADWITSVSPQLKVDSTWDKHSLRFNTGAEFGSYWHNDAENFADFWANLEGRYAVSDSTDLFGGAGFSRDHEDRDSPDADVGGLEPTTYQSLNAHAGIKTRVDNTTYRLGATFEALGFDDVPTAGGVLVNSDRDRKLYGVGLRATHHLEEGKELFAQALYDARRYDQHLDSDGFNRDSQGYRAAIGAKRDYGSGNTLEAYAGILGQDYDDVRFDSIAAFDFGGRASWVPQKGTKFSARVQRSLNETTLTGSPGYLSTSLSGRLEHQVSPRLIPHLSLRYGIDDFLQSGREDEVFAAEVGTKYYLTRNSYLSAGISHVQRDSNDVGVIAGTQDYDKTSVFISLTTHAYPLFEPAISRFETAGEIELGMISTSDDATRFGRYSGLTEQGHHWNGNLVLNSTDGERAYAALEAQDVALDSRSLHIDWGTQGDYEAFIDFTQIPFNDYRGVTPFEGVGSTRLTRPTGWVDGDETGDMTALNSSLREVEIGTLRKRLRSGVLLHSNGNRWSLSAGYESETKEGISEIAGVIGTSAGNARSALLPAPVDHTTNKLKAALAYQADRTQLRFDYLGSFFYNNLKTLTWESPFDNTSPRGSEGGTSLAPDNQFHQLTASFGQVLYGTTRLTGVASVGLMLQDDPFLPDTVDPLLIPHTLPRDSLEGEVYLYNAKLALSSRPLRGLNLKAAYRLQKRDNQTPQDAFTYYVNDSFGALTNSPSTTTNQPYSYDKRTIELDAGYRLNRMARLSGELNRETVERTPSEVKKTTEDTGRLKLHLAPIDTVQVTLSGSKAVRKGTDYLPLAGENPLLRKYNISDRERISSGIDITYQPTDRLSLSASAQRSDDDYDATQVGLTDARQVSATLDAAYRLTADIDVHGYLGRERYESNQAGSQVPNTADWSVQNDDTVDTLGIGVRWRKDERLQAGANVSLSRSTGRTSIQSSNALPPVTAFPDLKSNTQSIGVFADYKLRKDTTLKLGYQYERYEADDWSVDGTASDTIPEVLLLGESNGSYSQHVVGLSIAVRF